jgi:ABC-type nickel/cobalt efflux system permease component RcnA
VNENWISLFEKIISGLNRFYICSSNLKYKNTRKMKKIIVTALAAVLMSGALQLYAQTAQTATQPAATAAKPAENKPGNDAEKRHHHKHHKHHQHHEHKEQGKK